MTTTLEVERIYLCIGLLSDSYIIALYGETELQFSGYSCDFSLNNEKLKWNNNIKGNNIKTWWH